jgi:hypothetical protein
MTRLEDRQTLAADITAAHGVGTRLAALCALAGIDLRSLQRWCAADGGVRADRRPDAVQPTSPQALSEDGEHCTFAAASTVASSIQPEATANTMLTMKTPSRTP